MMTDISLETHIPAAERPSLVVNMRIQRDWAEMTMLCKGLQGVGIENVAYASSFVLQFRKTDLTTALCQKNNRN